MSKEKLVMQLINNFDKLKPRRANYDDVNQDITDFVLPNRGDFNQTTSPGDRRFKHIFDTTAVHAAEMLASVLHSGLTDPSSRWFNLVPRDSALADQEGVKIWLNQVHKILFHELSRSESGFSQQNHEFFLDLVAYGTAVMWVSSEPGEGLIFQTRHLAEIYIEEDSKGFVDTVYRCFKFTARQAAQQWGEEKLGKKVRQSLERDPHANFDFIHVVMPMKDYERITGEQVEKRLRRFEFVSVYICCDDKEVMDIGGFREMPYLVARWEKLVGEVYGRSPSWNALSDIKMINVMSETKVKKAQKELDPPLLMSDDGVMLPLQTFPGGINIGALSDDGRPLVQTLPLGGRVEIAFDEMEQRRESIRRAYFVDQFAERRGVQPLTATEANQRAENRLRLIGPQIRRLEDEYLSKLIDRAFSILLREGRFPELPQDVLDTGVDTLDLDIEYISPLAFTQRTQQLTAYNRLFANIGTFIEFNPQAMDNFDVDTIVREAAGIAGIPIDQLTPRDAVAQMREGRAQEQQRQQQMAEIQAGAETAATLQKSGIPII